MHGLRVAVNSYTDKCQKMESIIYNIEVWSFMLSNLGSYAINLLKLSSLAMLLWYSLCEQIPPFLTSCGGV